jgi:AcrR family transcriptional regulator
MVAMAAKAERTGRRADALSKERIVEAAIEILDADGESALTFRALATRLATGPARSTGTSPARTTCSRRPPTISSPGS